MGTIKSYNEFLNENLFGQYSYYGAGSLFPIVSKLASEGKTAQLIYTYLTSLGIDEERKVRVISKVFLNESIDFETFKNELVEKGLYEDDIDDILKADPKDLEKGIDPSKAKPDMDVKKALDKLKTGETDPKEDDKEEDNKEPESTDKINALRSALQDAEKLEKIKDILLPAKESK
jgi:hypothetical protein